MSLGREENSEEDFTAVEESHAMGICGPKAWTESVGLEAVVFAEGLSWTDIVTMQLFKFLSVISNSRRHK